MKENIRDEGRREREREDFDISKKRFLERKIAKHEKEDTERDRERERRGIIIKMREISKILDLRRNEDG